MKAIVFAAGLGTRLGDFTREHPKALVEVGGMPMLGRVLHKLRDAGVGEAVVNVHHFAGQIIDYLNANSVPGLDVHVSVESELLLETGGGILAALPLLGDLDEPLLLHNSDILTDFPLDEMLSRHVASEAEATLLVAERRTQRYLLFDGQSELMQGWTNIATGQVRPDGLTVRDTMKMRAFGGVHIMSPRILSALRAYNDRLLASGTTADSRGICRFSVMDFYIDSCVRHPFAAYRPSRPYRWCDIGKPDSLAAARSLFT